jgi:hypothetical protein
MLRVGRTSSIAEQQQLSASPQRTHTSLSQFLDTSDKLAVFRHAWLTAALSRNRAMTNWAVSTLVFMKPPGRCLYEFHRRLCGRGRFSISSQNIWRAFLFILMHC